MATTLLLCAGWLLVTGCARGNKVATGVDRETRVRMNILATFYGEFLSENRGIPPNDVESFREYLQSKSDIVEDFKARDLVGSLEELLTSARDEQPFVIACGKVKEVSHTPGAIWAAYEQSGIDGKRMAVRVGGGVDMLDDEQFALEFK